MRGRDDESASEVPSDDGVGDHRGRTVTGRQEHVVTVRRHDAGEFFGEPAGGLSSVVPDGDRIVPASHVVEVIGRGLPDHPDSWGGKDVEGGTPPGRPERNSVHARDLYVSRQNRSGRPSVLDESLFFRARELFDLVLPGEGR